MLLGATDVIAKQNGVRLYDGNEKASETFEEGV